MTSPLAAIFLHAEPERDPIFIHYSQPSIQVDWLLESIVDGSTWLRRFSSYEAEHNRLAKVRNGWLKAFQDLGFSPQFISSEQIERGRFRGVGHAVLVLPGSCALSVKETSEIRRLLEAPTSNSLLAEAAPGLFDQHGRLLSKGRFDDLIPPAMAGCFGVLQGQQTKFNPVGGAEYGADRLKGTLDWLAWIGAQLKSIHPEVSVPPSARTRIHRFRLGPHRLLAFERNIDYHMSEDLKQAGGNEPLERAIAITATLSQAAHVYDLRTRKYLGHTDQIQFTLDPWQPSLFAVTQQKFDPETIVSILSQH